MKSLSSQIATLEATVEELREFQNQILRLFTDKGQNHPVPAKVLERLRTLRLGNFGPVKGEKPGLEMAAAYFDDLAKSYDAEVARMTPGVTQKGYIRNAETLRSYEREMRRMAAGERPRLCSDTFATSIALRRTYSEETATEVREALKASENTFPDSTEEIAEKLAKHRAEVKEARKARKAKQNEWLKELVETLKDAGSPPASDTSETAPVARTIAQVCYTEGVASAIASRLLGDLISQKAPGTRVFYVLPKKQAENSPEKNGSEDLLSATLAIAESLESGFQRRILIHKDAGTIVEYFKKLKGE